MYWWTYIGFKCISFLLFIPQKSWILIAILFNQVTPLGPPRKSGRQRKIVDYKRLDKGLDSDEDHSTEKQSSKQEVLAPSKISSSEASRNVSVSIYYLDIKGSQQ